MRRKPAHAPANLLSLDELMPTHEELGDCLQDARRRSGGQSARRRAAPSAASGDFAHPVQLRIVLVLHDMEELTTEQVAQILDLQPGNGPDSPSSGAFQRAQGDEPGLVERAPMPSDCGKPSEDEVQTVAGLRVDNALRSAGIIPEPLRVSGWQVEPRTCDQMRQHIEACPACVAFLRDLRAAIDRCRSLEVPCDSAVAPRLRSILTQEYLRMLGLPGTEKVPAVL
jgi:RNA polymerase sigma-70 factor, ECF subfamily